MGDLKPLGSEKLNGDDKLKRILELTYYNSTPKKSTNNNTKAEMIKESIGNGVYGIVKERDGYYVKKGLNENSLDYIGGLFMKNKNKFSSYAEALKRLDLLVGQENLQEAKKYILKPKKEESGDDMGSTPPPPSTDDMGSTPPPPPPPSTDDMGSDMPAPPSTDDMGSDVPPPPSTDDMGSESGEKESKRSDYMSDIQKFSGKLGQELRDQREKLESDDIKYVLNMVISAVNLDSLEDEDIEEVREKFDRDNEEDTSSETPKSDKEKTPEVSDSDESNETKSTEDDLNETMDKLNDFIKSPVVGDDENNEYDFTEDLGDLEKYNDLGDISEKELDLDEMQDEINKRIGETLRKYFE